MKSQQSKAQQSTAGHLAAPQSKASTATTSKASHRMELDRTAQPAQHCLSRQGTARQRIVIAEKNKASKAEHGIEEQCIEEQSSASKSKASNAKRRRAANSRALQNSSP